MSFKIARGFTPLMFGRGFAPLMFGLCVALFSQILFVAIAHAKELKVPFLYLEYKAKRPSTLSNLVVPPADGGLQGMRLGILDNNTTGKFLKHDYSVEEVIITDKEDFKARLDETLASNKSSFIVTNMPADKLLMVADHPLAKGRLIFNSSSKNTDLRRNNCRPNVLHTMVSRRMLTDGLAQFLVKKKWTKILLIVGNNPGDKEMAQALKESAKKFRLKVIKEKQWPKGGDLRRNAAAEVPAFTQEGEYDVVFIADEVKDFGQYVIYHTWLPRPVVGNHGVEPVAWHWVVEQWGAAQLQSRFRKLVSRRMGELDYGAWTAVRTVAEAVTRLQTVEVDKLREYILGPKIRLAMFKGRSMSFRTWSGQMRQNVPLIHEGGAVVKLAPVEGFLHPHTELDTIGIDVNEAKCHVQK